MASNCSSCNCNDGYLHTTHNCSDSYPECAETNPCSEIISDLCVIHNPNAITITTTGGDNVIIPENINIHSYIQLMAMLQDGTLSQYAVDSNIYGPILGLRTIFVGRDIFKLRWDFPNVPDYSVMQTKFKITVKQTDNTSNMAVYLLDSSINTFTVFNYGTLVYQPNKSYYVKVELIDELLSTILTSSINIIVTTKQ